MRITLRHLPQPIKNVLKAVDEPYRLATARWRRLPEFLIIGAQKAGTTSLFEYLSRHPDINPAVMKEPHFFTLNYGMGVNWYRAQFPIRDARTVTGEATPYNLLHPTAPRRAHKTVPNARLIVLLRDPAERAISQYYHEVNHGYEIRPIEEAIFSEADVLPKNPNFDDPAYASFEHQHFAYLSRGRYPEQIDRWQAYFPREQIHLARSDDLLRHPEKTFANILNFLELKPWQPKSFPRYNPGRRRKDEKSVRLQLEKYFAPYNQDLKERFGIDFT